MTSHKISTAFFRFVAVCAVSATALAGCSTVKSVSPFGSNVPYAASIQPVIPRPAVSEIPAFKPKPAELAPAPKASAPAAEAPVPPAKSSAAQVPVAKVADREGEPAAVPAVAKPAAAQKIADESAAPAAASDAAAPSEMHEGPSLPADHRTLSQDGAYPNLAQVPARPVNLPSFAEAAVLEKSLVADRNAAKDAVPASPDAPSVDSTPVPVPAQQNKSRPQLPAAKPVAVAARAEDREPCLNGNTVAGQLAATIHFDPGSAAITAGNQAVLSEAVPTMRAAKGTIRIYGHGDAEAVGASRFDLGAARAAAVAQAVAGYGIPAPRIAVGVACADAAFAGASVQLYAES